MRQAGQRDVSLLPVAAGVVAIVVAEFGVMAFFHYFAHPYSEWAEVCLDIGVLLVAMVPFLFWLRRAERGIIASEERYRRLFECAHNGVVVADARGGEIIDANRFLLDLLNYSREDAIGKKLWDIGLPKELLRFDLLPEEEFSSGHVGQKDIHLKTSDGREIIVEIDSIVFRVRRGILIQCVLHNVTGRRWMEEQVMRLNRQLQAKTLELDAANRALQKVGELKDEFIGTVSHELRTPITIIKAGVDLVLNEIVGPINPKQKDALSVAYSHIDRLVHIVSNLLDIARIERGMMATKMASADLIALVEAMLKDFEPVAQRKGLEIRRDFPREGRIEIVVDEGQIVQVLSNLMNNAIKFTTAGEVGVSLTAGDGKVVCAVSDTGVGIAEEDLPKVFNKFQQFNRTPGPGERGTGLGLAICKGIIEAHGGEMKVESKPGRGSTFTFSLPLAAREAEERLTKLSV